MLDQAAGALLIVADSERQRCQGIRDRQTDQRFPAIALHVQDGAPVTRAHKASDHLDRIGKSDDSHLMGVDIKQALIIGGRDGVAGLELGVRCAVPECRLWTVRLLIRQPIARPAPNHSRSAERSHHLDTG